MLKYIIVCLPDSIYWKCFLLCFFYWLYWAFSFHIFLFLPEPHFVIEFFTHSWLLHAGFKISLMVYLFYNLFEVIGILKTRLLNLGICGFILWWIMNFLIILFNYLIFSYFLNVFSFQFCICYNETLFFIGVILVSSFFLIF